jgi:hypothetical protein
MSGTKSVKDVAKSSQHVTANGKSQTI